MLQPGQVEAHLVDQDRRVTERGAPSSWWFRPLEPDPTNYLWSAMLDPAELCVGVEFAGIEEVELSGRPAVRFTARAVDGDDPVCPCCALVYSEVSERLEHEEGWRAEPGTLPGHVDLALDLELGIVVALRDRGLAPGHDRRTTQRLLRVVR